LPEDISFANAFEVDRLEHITRRSRRSRRHPRVRTPLRRRPREVNSVPPELCHDWNHNHHTGLNVCLDFPDAISRYSDMLEDRMIERSHKKLKSHGRTGILDRPLGLLHRLWNLLLCISTLLHIDSNITGLGRIASRTLRNVSLVFMHVSIMGSTQHSEAAQRQCK
jgi:hypothetical protein